MKKATKQIISTLLVVVMLITSAPLSGFVGLELPKLRDIFTIKSIAKMSEDNIYEYEVADGGVTIVSCDSSISGDVIIPSTFDGYPVVRIGDSAFKNCMDITSISIPDSVTSIGDCAFMYCISLTGITIPDSVTSIGSAAFRDCNSLTSITIPDGVTAINSAVFFNCSSLINITIPDSVISIGNYAFRYCSNLTSVTIPDSVTSIGTQAFLDCGNLIIITIGNSVISIGDDAFNGCNNLKKTNYTGTIDQWAEISYSNVYSNPTCYSKDLYINDVLVETADLSTATKIGAYAFYWCKSLTSITIPASVTSMGDSVFIECDSLEKIIVDKDNISYSSIDGVLFNKDKTVLVQYPAGNSRVEYTIPDSVTSIDNFAFFNCSSLENVTIPDSVTSIGSYAFSCCDNLQKTNYIGTIDQWVEISFARDASNPTYYSEDLYINDVLVEDVDLSTATKIGANAFCNCKSLESLRIRNSVTSIGNSAFYGCSSLESVRIPDSVTSIGNYVFNSCSSLISITIPNGVTSIGYSAFYKCSCLTSITIPDSVISIGEYAFEWCSRLTSITIPNSVISIGEYAFEWCSRLTSITIPNSVTSVGKYAFYKCGRLESVTIENPNCEIYDSSYTFPTTAVIYGYNNSTAERYAEKYNREFVHIHEFAFVETVEATCTEPKADKYICSVCDLIKVEELEPALGHDYSEEWTVDRVETCTVDGSKSRHCSRCDSKIDVLSIPAPGHVWSDWGEKTAPTCTKTGLEHRTCSVCSTEETKSIPALGHDYYEIVTAPTCEKDGFTSHICSVCGNTIVDNIVSAFGHKYDDGTITSEPTCASEGVKEYVCETCNTIKTEKIAKLPHNYEESIVAPNCITEGYTLHICTSCGASYQDNVVAALGHDYASTHIEPSVDVEGHTLYECKRCDSSYVILDPAIAVSNFGAYADTYKINLTWSKAVEASVTGYEIFRKTTNDESFVLLTKINSRNTLSYVDKNLIAGDEYSYKIRAMKGSIEGEFSDVVKAIPLSDTEIPRVTSLEPTVSYTLNNNGDKAISGTTTFKATAEDNVGVIRFELYYSIDNGSTWNILKSASGSSFNQKIDTTSIPDSIAMFKVLAYDNAGNVSSGTPIRTYKVDNTGLDKINNVRAVSTLSSILTLAWDNVESTDISSFILEQKVAGNFKQVQKGLKTLGANITNLNADTEYTFRVVGVDICGNIGVYSDEFTVRTAKDTQAPVITRIGPSPKSINSSVSFYADAQDDCSVSKITIRYSTDLETWTDVSTKNITSYSSTASYTCNVDVRDIEDGSVYIQAVATDSSGNISEQGKNAPYIEYNVDKTAPAIPQNISAKGYNGYITINWDQGSENDIASYVLYRSTSENTGFTEISSNITNLNYIDRNTKVNTTYYYKVAVKDIAGNVSGTSSVVSARVYDDNEKPILQSIAPVDGSKIGISSKTVSVLATDNNMLSSIVVEYKTGLLSEYSVLKAFTSIGSNYKRVTVDLPIDSLNDSSKVYVRAYCVDESGNVSDYSKTNVYTVDKTAPEISNLEATVSKSQVTITWTDSSNTDAIEYKIYKQVDNGSYGYVTSLPKSDSHEYVFYDTIKGGTYNYRIDAKDSVGNTNQYFTESLISEEVVTPGTDIVQVEPPKASFSCVQYMEETVQEIFDASTSSAVSGIASYSWDFGDGTTSDKKSIAKSYTTAGTYTVTLTITDNLGQTASISKPIIVSKRDTTGIVTVKVYDENKRPLNNFTVYFDLGESSMEKTITDSNGVANVKMKSGMHCVGVYEDGYLPNSANVMVIAGKTTTVELTVSKKDIVTGSFEVKEMTPDEIIAAGIDLSDPANQELLETKITVIFGEEVYTGTITTKPDQETQGTETQKPKPTHVVTYVADGVVVAKKTFYEGQQSILAPTVPAKSGYSGRWEYYTLYNKRSDFTVNAVYSEIKVPDPVDPPKTHTATFIADDCFVAAVEFVDGESLLSLIKNHDLPQVPVKDGYVGKWNWSNYNNKKDSIIKAMYKQVQYDHKTHIGSIVELNMSASYLKSFFNADLYLFNNASSEYTISDCNVNVAIPDGLTLMNAPDKAPEIFRGGESMHLNYVLRGDKPGTYSLNADFSGVLDEFDERVERTFTSNEFSVYGPENIKLKVDILRKLKDGNMYFNVSLINLKDTPIYCPQINVSNYIAEVTNGYKKGLFGSVEELKEIQPEVLSSKVIDDVGNVYPHTISGDNEVPVESLDPGSSLVYQCVIKNVRDDKKVHSVKDAFASNSGYYENNIEINIVDSFNIISNKVSWTDGSKYVYKYYDELFDGPTNVYNHSLAMMSLVLELSAWVPDGGDYSTKYPNNVETLFNQIGFDNPEYYGYNKEPTFNSIACAIASKNIIIDGKKTTIIACPIRGGGYESEWGGNFNMGKYGIDHEGFHCASEIVLNNIDDYITKYGDSFSENIIYWIVGYSRAGAVANLVSSTLNLGGGNFTKIVETNPSKSNVFCYCFETPQSTTNAIANIELFDNIINIVNPIDPIPYLAPSGSGFDFRRYGVTYYLPSSETNSNYKTLVEEMNSKHQELYSRPYNENFAFYKLKMKDKKFEEDNSYSAMKQATYIRNMVNILCNDVFKDREHYYKDIQDGLSELIAIYLGNYKGGLNIDSTGFIVDIIKLVESMLQEISNFDMDTILTDLKIGLANVISNNTSLSFEASYQLLGKVKNILYEIIKHPNYSYTAYKVSKDNNNYQYFFDSHWPNVNVSWMAYIESLGENGKNLLRRNRSYLIYRINCPVDVLVYNSNDELVASIVNDTIVLIEDSTISYYIDDVGQKTIVLPMDSQYTIKMEATDSGTVNCQIEENVISDTSNKRIINYYDMPVEKGDTLVAEDDQNEYPIYKDNVRIFADEIFENNDIEYSNVKVSSNFPNNSVVFGDGSYTKGEFAKVSVISDETVEFLGWYSNEKLISNELEYRFKVDSDIELIAVFKKIESFCDHDYKSDNIQASCVEVGTITYTCKICGNSYFKEIPATGHTEGEWIIDENSNCINGGTKHQICSVCGETIAVEVIEKTAHTYVPSVTTPTCTTDGYTTHTCSVCGTSYTDSAVSKTGHKDANDDGYCDVCKADLGTHKPTEPTKECDCKCHSKGFTLFIWKIGNFFRKIFGKDKTCKCGAKH